MAAQNTCNHPINHIGISVPDVEAAAKWYIRVLGFARLRPSSSLDRSLVPDAPIFKIYPSSVRKMHIAYLSSGNGVGIELFQFDPPVRQSTESGLQEAISRGGAFHICVTTADVEKTGDRVVAQGGKRIGEAMSSFGQDIAYVQDPWGNVVELLSCSFERLLANTS